MNGVDLFVRGTEQTHSSRETVRCYQDGRPAKWWHLQRVAGRPRHRLLLRPGQLGGGLAAGILHFAFFAFLQICPPVPQWLAIGLVWRHWREREAEKFRHIRYLAEFLLRLNASWLLGLRAISVLFEGWSTLHQKIMAVKRCAGWRNSWKKPDICWQFSQFCPKAWEEHCSFGRNFLLHPQNTRKILSRCHSPWIDIETWMTSPNIDETICTNWQTGQTGLSWRHTWMWNMNLFMNPTILQPVCSAYHHIFLTAQKHFPPRTTVLVREQDKSEHHFV